MDTVETSEAFKQKDLTRIYACSIRNFEAQASLVCRGFKVAMAVNIFGVGTLLPNNLPGRSEAQRRG